MFLEIGTLSCVTRSQELGGLLQAPQSRKADRVMADRVCAPTDLMRHDALHGAGGMTTFDVRRLTSPSVRDIAPHGTRYGVDGALNESGRGSQSHPALEGGHALIDRLKRKA